MRILLQRVKRCRVAYDGQTTPWVERGLLGLVGFEKGDTELLLAPMAEKMMHLRIFPDQEGKMNRSLLETKGGLALVSQFTLHADCKKGRRPSFFQALEPQAAAVLYERLLEYCRPKVNLMIFGRFGADMQVELINDGPVTLMLDSREIL